MALQVVPLLALATNSEDLLRKLLVKVAPIKQQTNLRDTSVKAR